MVLVEVVLGMVMVMVVDSAVQFSQPVHCTAVVRLKHSWSHDDAGAAEQ